MTKVFKYLFLVIVLILSMASCSIFSHDKKDNQASEVVETEGASENEDSVRTGNNDATYQYQELAKQVEALNDSIVTMKTELSTLANQSKNNKKWRLVAIVAVGLAVITLIILCVYRYKMRQMSKHIKNNNDAIQRLKEKLKNTQWEYSQRRNETTQDPSIVDLRKNLEKRISSLEKIIKETPSPQGNNVSDIPQPSTERVYYAKTNSQNVFTEVLPSMKEGCNYKITSLNDKDGEFEVIKLSIMRQTSKYKDVVEIVDGCSLNEATRYDIVSPGKCVKIEKGKDTVWKVTDKLKIKTLK